MLLRIIVYGIKTGVSFWFIHANMESIIFDYLTSHEDPTGVGSIEIKKRVWKRGKQALREGGFSK